MTERVYLRPTLTRPVLARPRGPLARGMALDDGVNFKEGDHPRDSDGKFKTGAAAASAVVDPPAWMGSPGKALKNLAVEGLKKGESPQAIADKMKDITKGHKHTSVAFYANNIIALLEKHHELKPGHLGKATSLPKTAAAAKPPADTPPPAAKAPPPAPPPAPKPSVNLPVPPPPAPGATQVPTPPGEPKKFQPSPAGFEKPAPEPDGTKKPMHFPEVAKWMSAPANAMKAVVESGLKSGSPPDAMADALKSIAKNYEAQSVAHYATSIIQQLESHLDLPPGQLGAAKPMGQAGAKPAPVVPFTYQTPPPSPPPSKPQTAAPAQAGVTKPPASSLSARRAREREAGARALPNVYHADARTIVPSLGEKFWAANPQARDAARSYTAGSVSINNALRGASEPSKDVLTRIHAIDAAFEQPEAKTTQDVIMRRGENVPADVLDAWEKKLKAGLPCRAMKEGFVSTSLANQAAFGGKNTIFQMVVRKGTPALGLDTITTVQGENEVLLRHGQAFEVYEIDRSGSQSIVKMMSI